MQLIDQRVLPGKLVLHKIHSVVETAKAMLGITGDQRVFELTSLFFPVRDDLIHVLHKTVRREGRRGS